VRRCVTTTTPTTSTTTTVFGWWWVAVLPHGVHPKRPLCRLGQKSAPATACAARKIASATGSWPPPPNLSAHPGRVRLSTAVGMDGWPGKYQTGRHPTRIRFTVGLVVPHPVSACAALTQTACLTRPTAGQCLARGQITTSSRVQGTDQLSAGYCRRSGSVPCTLRPIRYHPNPL